MRLSAISMCLNGEKLHRCSTSKCICWTSVTYTPWWSCLQCKRLHALQLIFSLNNISGLVTWFSQYLLINFYVNLVFVQCQWLQNLLHAQNKSQNSYKWQRNYRSTSTLWCYFLGIRWNQETSEQKQLILGFKVQIIARSMGASKLRLCWFTGPCALPGDVLPNAYYS